MDDLRQGDAGVQSVGICGGLRSATDAAAVAAESAEHGRRAARPGDEHGRQLRHEYELAELQRRDDVELSDANARFDRAELRVGGHGNGRVGGFDSRIRPALGADDRQLLVRPDPQHALHSSSAVHRRRFGARVARRGADVPAVSNGYADPADDGRRWKGRYGTAYCGRSGRFSGDHQATGHQRRRILQRQLRASPGEPDAAERIHRDAVDSADRRRPLLHVWADGRRHPAGLGGAGGHAGDLRAAVACWDTGPNNRAIPALAALGVDQAASDEQPGGNMEGKEARFGIAQSAIWAAATTAASNGSVNSMHDSYTPLGGLVPMWLMQLGEVVFGGVGSGLYGMLVFAIIAVFVAGLMVGRTPEYLGKKIEAFEMKMAALVILIPPMVVLVGAAVAVATDWGKSSISNTGGPHGFSEVLYAFSSAGNNNGSAFAGLNANTPFYNIALGIGDARGPLLAGDSHVGDCRFVGSKERPRPPAPAPADAYAAVRGSAGGRGDLGRCVDIRSGVGPRADCGTFDDDRWIELWQLKQKPIRLFDPAIVGRAVVDSFLKLDPRRQVRNPVMFTVYIGSILTTGLFALSLRFGGEEPPWFIFAISAWLWFTVLFANFAEAMAEGRGKAQADALRRARHRGARQKVHLPSHGTAPRAARSRRCCNDGDLTVVPASDLRRGDVVFVAGGRLHSGGRRNYRRRCLGRRKRHHRRKRPGDPRKRRRPQQRDRRHAGLVRLARRASHRRSRRNFLGSHDCDGRRGQTPKNAQRNRLEHSVGRHDASSSCWSA